MSKQELSAEISADIINSLILTGDMSKLTPAQQTQYYGAVCKELGLNPLTQPFAIIVLNGKKILYATKGCTQQLCATRKINTEVKNRETRDSIYIVSARATTSDGRFTDDDGIVAISGLKGLELANAMMKAVTKAKRRAVLALCGLGMPDESEIDEIVPGSQGLDAGKSRIENIIDAEAQEVSNVKEEGKKEVADVVKKESNKKTTKEPTGPNGSDNESTSRESENVGISHVDLKQGEKLAQGTISGVSKIIQVDRDGKRVPKVNFEMEGNKYGLFLDTKESQKLFDEICAVMDIQKKSAPIVVNLVYSERVKDDKTFKDLITFKQATAQKVVPI